MNIAKILLAEDDPEDAKLVRKTLRRSKLLNEVEWVQDGQTAIDYLLKKESFSDVATPDLIILDLNLPKRSGQEVLDVIKSSLHLRRIPVAIMTSSDAEEDVAKSYELGANCYIKKPIDLHQIEKVVLAIQSFWFSVVTLPETTS